MSTARAFEQLLRWLGPWADPLAVPSGVRRRELHCDRGAGDTVLRVFVYTPEDRPICGALVLAHGLHPAGPLDPRLDRFIRILAHAGLLVVAPALPSYQRLRCDPDVVVDFTTALDTLRLLPECPSPRPGLLSISFGSYPVLRLLADPVRGLQLNGAIVFGGYGDPKHALRYTLGERGPGMPPPDPLSMPAIAINLVDALPVSAAMTAPVSHAWLELARATWGKPELKQPVAFGPIAHTLARNLDSEQRLLFLRGCGLTDDAHAYWLHALASDERLASIDPRPHLHTLRRPLHLMHGRDDDVIPCSELEVIAAACPKRFAAKRYLTGLYSHTGTASVVGQLRAAPALAREGITLVRMLRALLQVAGA